MKEKPNKPNGKRHEQDRTKKNKANMLESLQRSLGNITLACKKANIDRVTHYEYLKTDPAYKAAVEEVEERALDFSEATLLTLIKEKNPQAVFFHLKMKGKKRGYVERQELENVGDQHFVVEIVGAPDGTKHAKNNMGSDHEATRSSTASE